MRRSRAGDTFTGMHRMTVSFGEEEFKGLQALARRADRSHAWIVRYAVRELLERVDAGQLQLPLPLPRESSGSAPPERQPAAR